MALLTPRFCPRDTAFGLLVSRMAKEEISTILSHHGCGYSSWKFWERDPPRIRFWPILFPRKQTENSRELLEATQHVGPKAKARAGSPGSCEAMPTPPSALLAPGHAGTLACLPLLPQRAPICEVTLCFRTVAPGGD